MLALRQAVQAEEREMRSIFLTRTNPIKKIMTREEKVFQMALAIAPTVAYFGIAFTRQLINEKKNPKDFTFNGRSIPVAHGGLLREWAEAFVDELNVTEYYEQEN